MKNRIVWITSISIAVAVAGAVNGADEPRETAVKKERTYDMEVARRLDAALDYIQADPWPSPRKSEDFKQHLALLLLYRNEKVPEANRLILEYCNAGQVTNYAGKVVPKNRSEALYRIYLTERTHRLLTGEASRAIEVHAWKLLTEYTRGITRTDADKPFWQFASSENHYLNDRRRYTLALHIVCKSAEYGPTALLEGETAESHCQAWVGFWIRYFRDRAPEGLEIEVAHPSSYGQCTAGVYYDLFDLVNNAELKALAGRYLTLYWAEVASEFEPRTGNRAFATTRMSDATFSRYWARPLLSCYGWHDAPYDSVFLGNIPFLISDYRPRQILSAIARDRNRGEYLATSRRAGMVRTPDEKGLIFDRNGDAHFRRDVYYSPDYTLATMTLDPNRSYDVHLILAQTLGATFPSDRTARFTVQGTGYYARRALSGMTAAGVSIIARDPNAHPGRGRFKSDGTRVFVSHGDLWKNRVEDASGWLFTCAGNAFAAVRPAAGGYKITSRNFAWPNRMLQEVEEKNGYFMELEDMWAPVIIQMGRAKNYESFEAFQASVKDNPLTYEPLPEKEGAGKLTYVSEAGERFEYWANSEKLPRINGEELNLNSPNTYDSPFLSMVHGEQTATISYPGYDDVVLDFSSK